MLFGGKKLQCLVDAVVMVADIRQAKRLYSLYKYV